MLSGHLAPSQGVTGGGDEVSRGPRPHRWLEIPGGEIVTTAAEVLATERSQRASEELLPAVVAGLKAGEAAAARGRRFAHWWPGLDSPPLRARKDRFWPLSCALSFSGNTYFPGRLTGRLGVRPPGQFAHPTVSCLVASAPRSASSQVN